MFTTLLVLLFFIFLSSFLVWFLVSHDKGPKESLSSLWIASGFGVLAIIFSVIVQILTVKDTLSGSYTFNNIFFAMLIVAFSEEVFKFLPLSLYIKGKQYFNEHTDGIIYFAIAGLTFGLIENLLYSISGGASVGVARLLLVPFFHASSTALVGYYFAKKRIYNKSWTQTLGVLGLMIIIHAFYNSGLMSKNPYLILVSIMLTMLLTICLFLFFQFSKELDKREGIQKSENNKYCPKCGNLNINETYFCEKCGNKI